MKNAFFTNVKKAREEGYIKGVWDGMRMGFNLVAIALNHNKKFRFGEQRLSELEADVQALADEMLTNDPYVNKVHIETAVKQIRGKAWVDE